MIGVVLDIDGVIIRDGTLIPGSKEALEKFLDPETRLPRVPMLFLTNSAGYLEQGKADALSALLGFPIDPSQVIMSHTPFKSLLPDFQDKPVLVIGQPGIEHVARGYGFKKVATAFDVASTVPGIFPQIKYDPLPQPNPWAEGPFSAILAFQDPTNQGEALQIATDVLRSASGTLGVPDAQEQTIPLYVANPDFDYAGAFKVPRMTMGSWLKALETIYTHYTGQQLKSTVYGKPTVTTYDYASVSLARQIKKLNHDAVLDSQKARNIVKSELDAVYMIGDNPHSDIAGGNAAGRPWHSLLVLTGCWKSTEQHPEHKADKILDDLAAAVDMILEKHPL